MQIYQYITVGVMFGLLVIMISILFNKTYDFIKHFGDNHSEKTLQMAVLHNGLLMICFVLASMWIANEILSYSFGYSNLITSILPVLLVLNFLVGLKLFGKLTESEKSILFL